MGAGWGGEGGGDGGRGGGGGEGSGGEGLGGGGGGGGGESLGGGAEGGEGSGGGGGDGSGESDRLSGGGGGGGGQPGVAPTLPPPCRQLPHVLATWFCVEQACRCKLEHVLPPIPGLSKWYALHVNVVEVKIVTEPAL